MPELQVGTFHGIPPACTAAVVYIYYRSIVGISEICIVQFKLLLSKHFVGVEPADYDTSRFSSFQLQ